MYCAYQDREKLEDDLYREDDGDSDGSEANSELEFHLYSQLHYSSNAGEMEEQVESCGGQQLEVNEKAADLDEEQKQSGESRPPSPNINKLKQHLKKKNGDNRNTVKKWKSNPKGQKSSFCFEEVIVIDSSPDVISISDGDTSNNEDGVCAVKGQSSQRLQTSTPAQKGSQKRSLVVPVTVDSSSSGTDSEESESKPESDSSDSLDSSDSSDSDGLENWMILGRGNQDGDQSISLNLEGGSDSNAGVEEEEEGSWLVSDKDKEARIHNKDKGVRSAVQRMSNRYYTSKNVQCRNCNKNGHLSKNCPEPKKLLSCFLCGTPGHPASQCPNKHCNNCGMPGHLYESCSERAYWHKQCHRCDMTGHFFDACPEIWRQYHITIRRGPPAKQQGGNQGRTPAYCYNCSRRGHYGHACTQKRMFNGTYPTTPFINHYDTVNDINRRQHRIKLKVKELKKNGFFPVSSQTPLTPGPPKKKQKISYHKNNHQLYHTPQQSQNNHKPSPTHIFFNEDKSRGLIPKTNKRIQHKSTGIVKPWKPKRPVPSSRDTPGKLILDEADDFPRGGGTGENIVRKKRRKRAKKPKEVLSVPPASRPNHLCWTREMPRSKSEPVKRRRKKRGQKSSTDNKKLNSQMYPVDENLFIIKQRGCKR